MNAKQKLIESIKKKKLAEGLSPNYKNGRITPETRGLGPEYEKDLKFEIMKKEIKKPVPKKKKWPEITNYKNLA